MSNPLPRTPDGVAYVEPHLATAPREEQVEYLRGFIANGPPPSRPVLEQSQALPSVPAGIFDPAALFQALDGRAEPYTMPNGQKVWVHPVSVEQVSWITRQVLRELRKAGLMKEPDSQEQAQERQIESEMRSRVWYAVQCCKQGPEADAAQVFPDPHRAAEALRRNPGYLQAVTEIAGLAERLSQGKSEWAALKEQLAGFFGRMESWLECLISLSETDLPTGSCRRVLTDCASSTSSIKRDLLGGTNPGTCLWALALAMQDPTPRNEE
jgi:hypothetical protein